MTAHDPPGASYAIGAVRSVGSNRTSSNNHPSGQCPKVQYSIRLKGDTGEATPLPSSSQDRRRERNHGKFNRFRFQTMRGNPLADGRNHRRWDRARQIPLQLLRLKGEPSSASGGFSSQKKKKKKIFPAVRKRRLTLPLILSRPLASLTHRSYSSRPSTNLRLHAETTSSLSPSPSVLLLSEGFCGWACCWPSDWDSEGGCDIVQRPCSDRVLEINGIERSFSVLRVPPVRRG